MRSCAWPPRFMPGTRAPYTCRPVSVHRRAATLSTKPGYNLDNCYALFLTDCFVNASFRREILRVLNRGEAVNSLKRALYTGRVAGHQAKREDEMQAVADALSLLARKRVPPRTHCSHRAHAHRRHQLAWGVQLPDSSLRRPATALCAVPKNSAQCCKENRPMPLARATKIASSNILISKAKPATPQATMGLSNRELLHQNH